MQGWAPAAGLVLARRRADCGTSLRPGAGSAASRRRSRGLARGRPFEVGERRSLAAGPTFRFGRGGRIPASRWWRRSRRTCTVRLAESDPTTTNAPAIKSPTQRPPIAAIVSLEGPASPLCSFVATALPIGNHRRRCRRRRCSRRSDCRLARNDIIFAVLGRGGFVGAGWIVAQVELARAGLPIRFRWRERLPWRTRPEGQTGRAATRRSRSSADCSGDRPRAPAPLHDLRDPRGKSCRTPRIGVGRFGSSPAQWPSACRL